MCIVYAQCNRACYRFAQWFVMLSLPTPLVICDPCTSTSARLDPCAALDWTNLPISISPLVASRSKPLVSIGNLSNHVESVCTKVCLKFTPSQLYVCVSGKLFSMAFGGLFSSGVRAPVLTRSQGWPVYGGVHSHARPSTWDVRSKCGEQMGTRVCHSLSFVAHERQQVCGHEGVESFAGLQMIVHRQPAKDCKGKALMEFSTTSFVAAGGQKFSLRLAAASIGELCCVIVSLI